MTLDLNRFAKIASRMHSDNDNEALSAARLATQMLEAAGGHWSNILVSFPKAKSKQSHYDVKKLSIEEQLSFIKARVSVLPEKAQALFQGLNLYFEANAWLSDKQRVVLVSLYQQAANRSK